MSNGHRPMHKACKNGHLDVKLLYPLRSSHALLYSRLHLLLWQVAKYLRQQGAGVYFFDDPSAPEGDVPAHFQHRWEVDYLAGLLDSSQACNVQPIHLAALYGHTELVEWLLKEG
jgi:ankyrin repeat protein